MVITPPCDAITPQSSVVVVSGGDAILIKHKWKAGEKIQNLNVMSKSCLDLLKPGL